MTVSVFAIVSGYSQCDNLKWLSCYFEMYSCFYELYPSSVFVWSKYSDIHFYGKLYILNYYYVANSTVHSDRGGNSLVVSKI